METIEGYYRFPSVNGESICFVSEGDLWLIESMSIRRLTSGSCSSYPIFNAEATLIAFSSCSSGANEIYLISPKRGGLPTRLTYCGANNRAVCFNKEMTHVIFSSNYRCNGSIDRELYIVSIMGGEVKQFHSGIGPANHLSFQQEGDGFVIGRHTFDPHVEEWKGYAGGRMGHIWITKDGSSFERLIKDGKMKEKLNIGSPMWISNRIYFTCDPDSVGNIYSVDLEGFGLIKHTNHIDFNVRNPSTDGKSIVYHIAGDIYKFNVLTGETQKVNIEFSSNRPHHATKFASASEFLEEVEIHPTGEALAIISRGHCFLMNLWEGPSIQIPYNDNLQGITRFTSMAFLHDGRLLASNATGLKVFDSSIALDLNSSAGSFTMKDEILKQFTIESPDVGEIIEIVSSPTSDCVAVINHRLELLLLTLKENVWQVDVLDKSNFSDGIEFLTFSPSGEYISYSCPSSASTSIIKIVNINDKVALPLTVPRFKHSFPSFDPEGRYLYFVSARDFLPIEDEHQLAFGFPEAERIYLLTLQKHVQNPFTNQMPKAPGNIDEDESDDESESEGESSEEEDNSDSGSESDYSSSSSKEKEKEKKSKKKKQVKKEIIDFDGIVDRIASFPISVGRYSQVSGIDKENVIYIRHPLRNKDESLDSDNESSDTGNLMKFNFVKNKETLLIENVLSFSLCKERHTIAVMMKDDEEIQLRVLEAGVRLEEEDEDGEAIDLDNPGRESGLIDIDNRLSLEIFPLIEWKQMFEDAWNDMQQHFYDKEFRGIDWLECKKKYLPLISRVGIRQEFGDLLSEMLAELGCSHAYESGGDYYFDDVLFQNQGFLGVDTEYDEEIEAYRILSIVKGDTYNDKRCGSLVRLGLNVESGDYIFSINKRRVNKTFTINHALANQNGKEVFIDVGKKVDVEEAFKMKSAKVSAEYSIPLLPTTMLSKKDEPEEKLQVNSRIVSRYNSITNGNNFCKGIITNVNANGTFNLKFNNGRVEKNVQKKWVKPEQNNKEKKGEENYNKKAGGKNKKGNKIKNKTPQGGEENSRKEEKNKDKEKEKPNLPTSWMSSIPLHTIRTKSISLQQEQFARYRDYVEKNAAYVHHASNNKVGYVFVPDMDKCGYAEFHRYYLVECQKHLGLIVDVRGNSGGYVSELLLEKLMKKHLGYGVTRYGDSTNFPENVCVGAIVMLIDENTSSDGDIIAASFKQLNLGLTVGKRTWGGVIGISISSSLVDGTTVTIPSEAYYSNSEGFGIENKGVEPDIEIDYTPNDYQKKEDPQLKEAIDKILPLVNDFEEKEKNMKNKLTFDRRDKKVPFALGAVELS